MTIKPGTYKNAEEIKALRASMAVPMALSTLSQEYEVELNNDPTQWKGRVVKQITDVNAYLQNKTEILEALKERWKGWKAQNHGEISIARTCEKHLQVCETTLKLMKEALQSK